MSENILKVVAGTDVPDDDAATSPASSGGDFTEELPLLRIDATSFDARMAGVESCSVARELAKHWCSVTAFEVEQEQMRQAREIGPPEDEDKLFNKRWLEKCTRRHPDPDELVEFIKRKASRFINWGDIGTLWKESPAEGIELWRALRLEARDEFFSGHYGARAFESAGYMHEAYTRAQYLAVRDGLVDEWKPKGATEFILIDQMTQAYVMQLHWLEKAMRRSQTAPRTETHEYLEWKRYRRAEAKANQWDKGYWDIPYQHEAVAVEQAFRLVDLCMKTFQRAARQLANIRLVRAKTARLKRRDKMKVIKGVRVA